MLVNPEQTAPILPINGGKRSQSRRTAIVWKTPVFTSRRPMKHTISQAHKKLSSWFRIEKYRLWLSSLLLEKFYLPWSDGCCFWHDIKWNQTNQQRQISDSIKQVPVGLHWKTSTIRSQGPIPKDHKVQVIHVYMDEMDVASRMAIDHKFPNTYKCTSSWSLMQCLTPMARQLSRNYVLAKHINDA